MMTTDTTTLLRKAAEFDALRMSASSMDDIKQWLMDNLDHLTGGVRFPAHFETRLRLNYGMHDPLPRALHQRDLRVDTALVVLAPFVPSPVLGPQANQGAHEQVIYFNHDSFFSLKLEEWPLATAIIAAKFVKLRTFKRYREIIPALTPWMEQLLAKHFPRVTLEQIINVAEAHLVPVDANGHIQESHLCTMLMDSRAAGNQSRCQMFCTRHYQI